MSDQVRSEGQTQNLILTLFCQRLRYRYLGDWSDRANNCNIETKTLRANRKWRDYTDAEIAILEACHDKTRDLKQGMMQELLNGMTRLV